MKKLVTLILMMVMIVAACTAIAQDTTNQVLKQTTTVHFTDVDREGLYTGEVNSSGEPHGFGVFESANSKGVKYVIVGYFENAHQNGEGWISYENGELRIGQFENGELIKGKYVTEVKMKEYDKAYDTSLGYTPESLFKQDWSKLDDESVIALISSTFGSEPLSNNDAPGYVWLASGYKFCDLDIIAVWASVDEKGSINAVNYMMTNSKYKKVCDGMPYDLDVFDKLVSRINARTGKTGAMILDDEPQASTTTDDYIKAMAQVNASVNDSVVLQYTWDYTKGVIFNATRNTGTVLVTMMKQSK